MNISSLPQWPASQMPMPGFLMPGHAMPEAMPAA